MKNETLGKKPLMLRDSKITDDLRIYAFNQYRELKGGIITVTGKRENVTDVFMDCLISFMKEHENELKMNVCDKDGKKIKEIKLNLEILEIET